MAKTTLSERQQQVVALVAQGLKNSDVAQAIGITERVADDQKRARITELRRDISDTRASRVGKMRKQAQAQLASASL